MKYFMTIAASDNSGGAGIQQDLMVADRLGLWGLTTLTGVTVQDFSGLDTIQPLTVDLVREQFIKNMTSFSISAIKIGALCSVEIAQEVTTLLKEYKSVTTILDPIFAPTKGASFMQEADVEIYRDLLNEVTVVTPNKSELEILSGKKINSLEEALVYGKELAIKYGCAIYVKGGHFGREDEPIKELLITKDSVDYFTKERKIITYSHGTGCFFASALGSFLARGNSLKCSCEKATLAVSDYYSNLSGADLCIRPNR
ncbi:MAG: hypothetical protein B6226_02565 [Candidatus Cloacimonetes bacterium 4572_65]|nr:MAG: hypothetical protein B6226_02565 [Candidatus Cloacimonetes bacterium 4572_65]